MPTRNLLTAVAIVAMAAGAASGCGSPRTKTHDGVELTLLSVARLDSLNEGMMASWTPGPGDDLAVAQVQFREVGGKGIKLPAADCVLTDENGAQYRQGRDVELTFGSGKAVAARATTDEKVMVWDFVFAVPKAANLRSVRFGAVTFDLGGVRDLDPGTRVMPGEQTRQKR